MRIAAVGYFGFGNFGDELFLKTFQQLFPQHQLHAWSADQNPASIDRVIIGGGDLIIPAGFHPPYFPKELAGKPTVVYGVGVSHPNPDAVWPAGEQASYKKALTNARALFTRDPRSAQTIQAQGIFPNPQVAPDVAYAYREPDILLRPVSNRPTCGIVVANYPTLFNQDLLLKVGTDLALKGWHLLFIPVLEHPTNPFADRKLCLTLMNAINAKHGSSAASITAETYDLEHTYRRLQMVDCLISYKMHPSLAALRGGVPVLCFSNSYKKRYLLDQYGLGRYVIPIKGESIKVLPVLERLVSEYQKLGPAIKSRSAELAAEARICSKRLIDLVLQ